MRDPHTPDHLPPPDWASAFAALPPETPPADALSSVFARIPASTPTRPGRQWWIAAAAVLALAAVVPFARHSRESGNPAVAVEGRSGKPTAVQNQSHLEADSIKATMPVTAQKLDARLRGHDDGKEVAIRSGIASTSPTTDALPTHSTPIRVAKAETPHRKPHRTRKSSPASEPADKLMEPLYAESARLEALLALARDDRVASATAVALGSDFEARIAGIDAALMQPSLTSHRRLELWKDRVSALRAYASFESTQRALAASGERYDAMLVSID
jgi:hypothetical protein